MKEKTIHPAQMRRVLAIDGRSSIMNFIPPFGNRSGTPYDSMARLQQAPGTVSISRSFAG
jgi:hypothetical protein